MIAMIGTKLLLSLPTQLASLNLMAGMLAWCVGYSCGTGTALKQVIVLLNAVLSDLVAGSCNKVKR